MRTIQKKYKEVPAFFYESCLICSEGPEDKGDRVCEDGEWTRSKVAHHSVDNAARAASEFTENAILGGYEVIVRVVQDGTTEVRDYDER